MDDKLLFTTDNSEVMVSFNRCKVSSVKSRKEMKSFLVIAYFRKHITALGVVGTTFNNMVTECGYSVKSNSKPINDDFRDIIKSYISDGYISCKDSIDEIKNNQYFELQFSKDKNLFFCDKKFVQLNMNEFDLITKSKTKSRKDILLMTFLNIKQYIYINNEMSIPKLSYPTKKSLLQSLGVTSSSTIETAINDLVNIGILYKSDDLYYLDKDEFFVPVRKLYAIDKDELKYSYGVIRELYNTDQIFKRSEIKLDKIKYIV